MDVDRHTVVAAQSGDRKAMRTLFERYVESVRRVVAQVAARPDLVDDVTQLAFVKAFNHLSTLEQPERFFFWLMAIARRTALDQRRREKTEQQYTQRFGAEQHVVTEDSPLARVLLREESEQVARLIAQIEDRALRETAAKFYQSPGHTVNEIAVALNIPVSTVTTRLARFRRLAAQMVLEEADCEHA